MDDVLGYAGKRVVVTGAASGMGEATARILVELGANVTGVDIKPTSFDGVDGLEVDLRDKASLDGAINAIGAGVDSFFNCAGLPGGAFSDLDVMTVNFIGARHLIEHVADSMNDGGAVAWVASNGGLGWQDNLATITGLLDTDSFESAVEWCESNPAAIENGQGYPFSKQTINAYVARNSGEFYDRGVRINCTNPGPTETAMMPFFEETNGKELLEAALGPIHRYSTAVEQAWPLVMLNSPRLTYVTGESFFVDGGFWGALQTGQIDFSHLFPSEE